MELILIKYGELTTKGENREEFIKLLAKNIKNVLKKHNPRIDRNRVRMYIYCDNVDEAIKKLTKVFGIYGIVKAYKLDADIDKIKDISLKLLKDSEGTFKVETNRADKNFGIKSMDFNNLMGGYILKNTNLKVDVHNPDTVLHIEIRCEGTYIYTDVTKGIGGYPVGTQGKGLLMLSGGIDSPVAGYLALKRGVDIDCLYFEAPPHTSPEAKEKVRKLASIINQYSGNIRLLVVPFTKLQESIYKNHADTYMITIMRRMMYRIASEVCRRNHYKAIINGESIGQVASQTLDSIGVIECVSNMPVIRPVACMDKLEIIDIANEIGTYETSILPYEDCCTIFLPKHPVINPVLDRCLEYESRFDWKQLVNECVDNIETISKLEEDKSDLL